MPSARFEDVAWDQLSLAELRLAQDALGVLLKQRVREERPPAYVLDPERFGKRRYQASIAQVAPASARAGLADRPRCILGCSLGSRDSEGARLEGCVKWVSENFRECMVLVGDSIYRYALQVMFGTDPIDSRGQAMEKGRQFIDTYRYLFESYGESGCRFEVWPISTIEQSPRFPHHHDELRQLFRADQAFRRSVETFAGLYVGGSSGAGDADRARKVEIAGAYLLEESALFACLVEGGWPVFVFPGAIRMFQDIVEGAHPGVPEPLRRMVFVALRLTEGGLYFAEGGVPESAHEGFLADSQPAAEVPRESHTLLAQLSDDDLERLMRYTLMREIPAGEVLVRQGQVDRSFYMVMDGEVEVLAEDADGKSRQLAIFAAGSVFGEQAFMDGEPRSATVAALCDCRVLQLTLDDFDDLRRDDPEIACAVLLDIGRILSMRVRHLSAQKH